MSADEIYRREANEMYEACLGTGLNDLWGYLGAE